MRVLGVLLLHLLAGLFLLAVAASASVSKFLLCAEPDWLEGVLLFVGASWIVTAIAIGVRQSNRKPVVGIIITWFATAFFIIALAFGAAECQ